MYGECPLSSAVKHIPQPTYKLCVCVCVCACGGGGGGVGVRHAHEFVHVCVLQVKYKDESFLDLSVDIEDNTSISSCLRSGEKEA